MTASPHTLTTDERLALVRRNVESIVRCNDTADAWRVLPLVPSSFRMLADDLPLRIDGELTPYVRISLVWQMLMFDRLSMPRLALSMMHYLTSMVDLIDPHADLTTDMANDGYDGPPEQFRRCLWPVFDKIRAEERRLLDFINPDVPVAPWCRRYGCPYLFHPAERTFEWEIHIAEVRQLTDEALADLPPEKRCGRPYWTKQAEVLRRFGIEWKSVAEMNPHLNLG